LPQTPETPETVSHLDNLQTMKKAITYLDSNPALCYSCDVIHELFSVNRVRFRTWEKRRENHLDSLEVSTSWDR